MIAAHGYAVDGPAGQFHPFDFERREPGPHDVHIEILYCGICHSDIHQARGEWGPARFPMVPGHEIVGNVVGVGSDVTRFRPGDRAGVGCFVDSCRRCSSCQEGLEQYCARHLSFNYNCTEQDLRTPTFGGYSDRIVVDEKYVLGVPETLDPAAAAPLLCAGITTWSPLRHFGAGPGTRVAVMGLGGLGHMGVKLARSLGAEVTVLSRSPSKEADAGRLGASGFVVVSDSKQLARLSARFDLILNTVSARHDLGTFVEMLARDGTIVLLGGPPEPFEIPSLPLVLKRRRISGSLIGGIRETQECLDYCGEHGIACDVEVVPIQKIGEAFDRTVRGDVRYRFVIDLASLAA
jgi:alcohol dehydrogenase (NADP+)